MLKEYLKKDMENENRAKSRILRHYNENRGNVPRGKQGRLFFSRDCSLARSFYADNYNTVIYFSEATEKDAKELIIRNILSVNGSVVVCDDSDLYERCRDQLSEDGCKSYVLNFNTTDDEALCFEMYKHELARVGEERAAFFLKCDTATRESGRARFLFMGRLMDCLYEKSESLLTSFVNGIETRRERSRLPYHTCFVFPWDYTVSGLRLEEMDDEGVDLALEYRIRIATMRKHNISVILSFTAWPKELFSWKGLDWPEWHQHIFYDVFSNCDYAVDLDRKAREGLICPSWLCRY